MMESTLAEAAEIMQGTLHGSDGAFRGISTDSRTLHERELFFALRGPHFDGAEYVPAAAAAGAAGAVSGRRLDVDLPTIAVDDTRQALGSLAASWRRRMPAALVGLTGSNGKTTLKELIASCLSLAAPTLATRGNLNNDIGVPLMLAEIGARHEFAVIELGANHPGEIAWLTSLVTPNVVVITNAGPAHLEGFGSVAGVARAKGEILQGEPRPEWAVLNADDEYFEFWKSLAPDLQVISFGTTANADVRAVDVVPADSGFEFRLLTTDGDMRITLPLAGRHNVGHAAAAAAVALALGIDSELIRKGLRAARPVSGRLNALHGIGGATVYDDSYNANPASVIAAAEFLAAKHGEAWLVLGDMGELGDASESLHRSVGETLRTAGIERVFAAGELSRHVADAFGGDAAWFESVDDLIVELTRQLKHATSKVSVLIKGSRAMHMERVVQAIRQDPVRRRQA